MLCSIPDTRPTFKSISLLKEYTDDIFQLVINDTVNFIFKSYNFNFGPCIFFITIFQGSKKKYV